MNISLQLVSETGLRGLLRCIEIRVTENLIELGKSGSHHD
jgi:hypothetical protein